MTVYRRKGPRCSAIRVGWGRCERKAGHEGPHFAGDEDAGGNFTTEEGKRSEWKAKLKSGELRDRALKAARELLKAMDPEVDQVCGRRGVIKYTTSGLGDKLLALHDAIKEVDGT